MSELCESHLPHDTISDRCEACQVSFINRTSVVEFLPPSGGPGVFVVPTIRYRARVCSLGNCVGKHLYSVTLVPGEEVELETFRSNKVAEQLSRDQSIEQGFIQEFSSTLQQEWSEKQLSNFNIGGGMNGGVNLGIVTIGSQFNAGYQVQEEEFQRALAEYSRKTQAKVASKFDIKLDLRTEAISTEKSIRRVRNSNQCQTVTYSYYQVMQKIHFTVEIERITFDVVDFEDWDKLPRVARERFDGVFDEAHFVPPRPHEVLSQFEQPLEVSAAEIRSPGTPPTSTMVASATVLHPVIATEFSRPFKHLSIEQLKTLPLLTARPGAVTPDKDKEDGREGHTWVHRRSRVPDEVVQYANSILARFRLGHIVIDEKLMLPTNGIVVDTATGKCLACDTHTALTMRAELDKMRADLLKEKLGGATSAAVWGFVQAQDGPVSGAVIRLQSGANVVAATVADGDGFYLLHAKGLVPATSVLTVSVTHMPQPLNTVLPQSASFKLPDAPVRVDFVAT